MSDDGPPDLRCNSLQKIIRQLSASRGLPDPLSLFDPHPGQSLVAQLRKQDLAYGTPSLLVAVDPAGPGPGMLQITTMRQVRDSTGADHLWVDEAHRINLPDIAAMLDRLTRQQIDLLYYGSFTPEPPVALPEPVVYYPSLYDPPDPFVSTRWLNRTLAAVHQPAPAIFIPPVFDPGPASAAPPIVRATGARYRVGETVLYQGGTVTVERCFRMLWKWRYTIDGPAILCEVDEAELAPV